MSTTTAIVPMKSPLPSVSGAAEIKTWRLSPSRRYTVVS
jgi:hypothetical protein